MVGGESQSDIDVTHRDVGNTIEQNIKPNVVDFANMAKNATDTTKLKEQGAWQAGIGLKVGIKYEQTTDRSLLIPNTGPATLHRVDVSDQMAELVETTDWVIDHYIKITIRKSGAGTAPVKVRLSTIGGTTIHESVTLPNVTSADSTHEVNLTAVKNTSYNVQLVDENGANVTVQYTSVSIIAQSGTASRDKITALAGEQRLSYFVLKDRPDISTEFDAYRVRIPNPRLDRDLPASQPSPGPTEPFGITGDENSNRFYISNFSTSSNFIDAYDLEATSNAIGQRITVNQSARTVDLAYFNARVYTSLEGTTGSLLSYNPTTQAADTTRNITGYNTLQTQARHGLAASLIRFYVRNGNQINVFNRATKARMYDEEITLPAGATSGPIALNTPQNRLYYFSTETGSTYNYVNVTQTGLTASGASDITLARASGFTQSIIDFTIDNTDLWVGGNGSSTAQRSIFKHVLSTGAYANSSRIAQGLQGLSHNATHLLFLSDTSGVPAIWQRNKDQTGADAIFRANAIFGNERVLASGPPFSGLSALAGDHFLFSVASWNSEMLGIHCVTTASDYTRGLLPWFFRPPVPIRAYGIDIFTQDDKNILVVSGGTTSSSIPPAPSTTQSPSGLYFFEILANYTVRPLAHMNVYWKANTAIADYWEFQPLTAPNLWGTQVSVRWPNAAMEWTRTSPNKGIATYNIRDKINTSATEGIPANVCNTAGNTLAGGVWWRNDEEIWVIEFDDDKIFIYQNSSFYPLVAKQ